MATTFPTSIQDLDATRGATGNPLNSPNHITHHTTEDDTVEALQAKIGIDGSAVTTSHDYKLSGVTGSDKAVSKTGTETLTAKTLTAPTVPRPTTTGTDTGTETLQNKTLGTGTVVTEETITLGSDATGDIHYRNAAG